MEVTTFADKFGYMLTRTGAICLKLCRAENLNVLYLAILLYRLVYHNISIISAFASGLHFLRSGFYIVKVRQGSQNLGGCAFCATLQKL